MHRERSILIKVFTYEDKGFHLKGNAIQALDCSFLSGAEMRQRVLKISTDSSRPDDEVVEYYISCMESAGIRVLSYEIFEMPIGITCRGI